MPHICVGNLTIIGSDNGLSPGRRQAIIWTNAGILLIGPLGINFSEILIKIITFLFKKMRLKVSSAKRRPFCFGLNVLRATLLCGIHVCNLSHYRSVNNIYIYIKVYKLCGHILFLPVVWKLINFNVLPSTLISMTKYILTDMNPYPY